MPHLSVRIDEKLLNRLDEAAALLGVTRSRLVRMILEECLDGIEERARPRPRTVRVG